MRALDYAEYRDDCLPLCLQYIFGCKLDDVPQMSETDWFTELGDWLDEFNIKPIYVDAPSGALYGYLEAESAGRPIIAIFEIDGGSVYHATVVKDNYLYDPHKLDPSHLNTLHGFISFEIVDHEELYTLYYHDYDKDPESDPDGDIILDPIAPLPASGQPLWPPPTQYEWKDNTTYRTWNSTDTMIPNHNESDYLKDHKLLVRHNTITNSYTIQNISRDGKLSSSKLTAECMQDYLAANGFEMVDCYDPSNTAFDKRIVKKDEQEKTAKIQTSTAALCA